MRVVMATDDVPIDRRILQEAESLADLGHEVILLAGHSPDLPTHETIGRIRVERPVLSAHGRREQIVASASARAGRVINAGALRSSGLLNRIGPLLFAQIADGLRAIALAARLASSPTERVEARLRRMARTAPEPSVSRLVAASGTAIQVRGTRILEVAWPPFMTAVARVVQRLWWAVGMTNARMAPLLLWIANKTRRHSHRDIALADRIAYYRPDLVHVHDLPQLTAGYLAARRCGVSLVYDAHELYPEIGTLTPNQQFRLGRIERRLTPHCDATITVNPYIAEEMRRRYRIERPHVILNAVDPQPATVSVGERDLKAALGLPADARVVLFQGWLSPTRGLDHLVRSIEHTDSDVYLVLMSYGEMITELLALADDVGVGERVRHFPAVPQHELLDWTASADVGVIPYPAVDLNHQWCSPNKLFEFIQAGLPIVANDLPFLRDVIVGEGIGSVAPIEDPERFGAAINEVLGLDRAGRAALDERVRLAAPRYSWAAQVPTLRTIYEQLTAQSRPSAGSAAGAREPATRLGTPAVVHDSSA